LSVSHGLCPLMGAGPLAHPHPDAIVAIVHDERVLGLEIGLLKWTTLDLPDPQGAVLVTALVQFKNLSGHNILLVIFLYRKGLIESVITFL
jgi:hypothetical protein